MFTFALTITDEDIAKYKNVDNIKSPDDMLLFLGITAITKTFADNEILYLDEIKEIHEECTSDLLVSIMDAYSRIRVEQNKQRK